MLLRCGADYNKREKFECAGDGVRCGCRIECQHGGTERDRLATQVQPRLLAVRVQRHDVVCQPDHERRL